MIRFLFFVLCLYAFSSCQHEKPKEEARLAPPAKLTALQDEKNQDTTVAETSKETKGKLPVMEKPEARQQRPLSTMDKPGKIKAEKTVGPSNTASPASEPATPDNQAKTSEPSKRSTLKPETINRAPLRHEAWDALLRQHVSASGKANYPGLLSDKAKLQGYLDELAANPVDKNWSHNERLAYWINAYNAYTIKLILDHYPVSSITKIYGGKPWDVKWIKLGNETFSLNNIENDIIRPRFNEPRIHFAVNCAARSCPPLLNRAWTANNLSRYLEQQARNFINNTQYNEINPDAAEISKIFEWYATDFGNIVDYLNRYSATRIQEGAKVSYKEYDWGLNE